MLNKRTSIIRLITITVLFILSLVLVIMHSASNGINWVYVGIVVCMFGFVVYNYIRKVRMWKKFRK